MWGHSCSIGHEFYREKVRGEILLDHLTVHLGDDHDVELAGFANHTRSAQLDFGTLLWDPQAVPRTWQYTHDRLPDTFLGKLVGNKLFLQATENDTVLLYVQEDQSPKSSFIGAPSDAILLSNNMLASHNEILKTRQKRAYWDISIVTPPTTLGRNTVSDLSVRTQAAIYKLQSIWDFNYRHILHQECVEHNKVLERLLLEIQKAGEVAAESGVHLHSASGHTHKFGAALSNVELTQTMRKIYMRDDLVSWMENGHPILAKCNVIPVLSKSIHRNFSTSEGKCFDRVPVNIKERLMPNHKYLFVVAGTRRLSRWANEVNCSDVAPEILSKNPEPYFPPSIHYATQTLPLELLQKNGYDHIGRPIMAVPKTEDIQLNVGKELFNAEPSAYFRPDESKWRPKVLYPHNLGPAADHVFPPQMHTILEAEDSEHAGMVEDRLNELRGIADFAVTHKVGQIWSFLNTDWPKVLVYLTIVAVIVFALCITACYWCGPLILQTFCARFTFTQQGGGGSSSGNMMRKIYRRKSKSIKATRDPIPLPHITTTPYTTDDAEYSSVPALEGTAVYFAGSEEVDFPTSTKSGPMKPPRKLPINGHNQQYQGHVRSEFGQFGPNSVYTKLPKNGRKTQCRKQSSSGSGPFDSDLVEYAEVIIPTAPQIFSQSKPTTTPVNNPIYPNNYDGYSSEEADGNGGQFKTKIDIENDSVTFHHNSRGNTKVTNKTLAHQTLPSGMFG